MSTSEEFRYRLWSVVESVRYWAPSITDVARIDELEQPSSWTFTMRPEVARACPFTLTLRESETIDLDFAGECYFERELPSLDRLIAILEAVSDGRVRHRHWLSPATASLQRIETIVALADGSEWRDGHSLNGGAAAALAAAVFQDSHFLPYRRR